MKTGTPGFVGARLREAREARGLTAIALAGLLGVTRAAVSQYETGLGTPRPQVMERISQVLNLPVHFFYRPVRQSADPSIFYRSLSTATKLERTRAERRFGWLHEEFIPYLRSFVELPAVHFPESPRISDPTTLSLEGMEDLGSRVRRSWGLRDGPISNMVWLLENNGAIVTRGELGAEDLDSFSAWVEGMPFVFLGTDKGSAVRSRFDAAHELAHLLLHRNADPSRLHQPSYHRLLEDQANRFAGAFLLPEATFTNDIYTPTLDAFRAIKRKWLVSIGVMISRVEKLGLVSDDQARRLWIAYSQRGWRRREPLDDELPIEEPRLQRAGFELLLSEGVQSRDDIMMSLPFAPRDVEELAVLPAGFLEEKPRAPVQLIDHSGRTLRNEPRPGPGGSEIVNFPKRER